MGSSPRVRGTHLALAAPALVAGIIPACAGNTIRRISQACFRRDHPRVCGEHDLLNYVDARRLGSSPRVRGTLVEGVPSVLNIGIIPACAGNTVDSAWSAGACGDHPRVCGEHFYEMNRKDQYPRIIPACAGNTDAGDYLTTGQSGSSPRVRGTRALGHETGRFAGIIPACAGNTFRRWRCRCRRRDHPRVCGEHGTGGIKMQMAQGSSPRVRGTRGQYVGLELGEGIIPACAGNTFGLLYRSHNRRDHPRVCGEHTMRNFPYLRDEGSSPRVRGTLPLVGVKQHEAGIIPACAGNTGDSTAITRISRDHPRVCGEHHIANGIAACFVGSSPRVRGTPGI